MSDDTKVSDFTPGPPSGTLDEVLHRLIAHALARAEGTLVMLAEMEAKIRKTRTANKKRGNNKKGGNNKHSNKKRVVSHVAIRSAADVLLHQMTAAQAALQHATSRDEKYGIAVRVHYIDAAFSPYDLRGLSPVTEYAMLERQALWAQTKRQPTPEQVEREKAIDASIDKAIQAGANPALLKPEDLKDEVYRHLPADAPMPYSTFTRLLRARKRARGFLKAAS